MLIELESQTAMLGLGGNLGDPLAAMGMALRRFDAGSVSKVVAVSRLYRTPPWGKLDQSPFLNACAAISTSLGPEALLALCLEIEREMKRERLERWGPRTLDIDLLTYGDFAFSSETLKLPHPRMRERGFVLMPLCDIAPDLMIEGKPASRWLAAADTAGIEILDESRDWWRGS